MKCSAHKGPAPRNPGRRCRPHWASLGSQLSLSQICVTAVIFAGSQHDHISVRSYMTSVSSFPSTLHFEWALFKILRVSVLLLFFGCFRFTITWHFLGLFCYKAGDLGFFLVLFPSLFEFPQVSAMTVQWDPACRLPAPPQPYRSCKGHLLLLPDLQKMLGPKKLMC